MSAKDRTPTWLYHKTKGGRIHALAAGAPFPKGWRDTPWPAEEKASAEEVAVKKTGGVILRGSTASQSRTSG